MFHARTFSLFFILAMTLFPNFSASKTVENKGQLQTAFIYKFIHYVEWPKTANSGGKFVVAIWKNSSLVDHFRDLSKTRKVKGRNIEVIEIDHPSQGSKSHLCVLIDAPSRILNQIAVINSGHSIIVTEESTALSTGSMFNLINEDGLIRFEVNRSLLEQKGFNVSSQLLRLARNVR